MSSDLLTLDSKPHASYMIAGWKPQWSDGGEISSGLPEYLISKFNAKRIGGFTREITMTCYPFQVPGTHDAFRPGAAFDQGLPSRAITRDNSVYDAGNGLIIFQGEEPWFRLDMYSEAFFGIAKELELEKVVVVEGYNGPGAAGDRTKRELLLQPAGNERRVGEVFGAVFELWIRPQGRSHHRHGAGVDGPLPLPGNQHDKVRGHGSDVLVHY